MRLLHTSDWHLGQTLHNFERVHEHQCFLDWLLDTLVAERADALLVAGDIFDNANPSAASHKQLYRFLQRARQRLPHLNLVIIAGNHDSPGRLEAPAPLLEGQGTHIIGHVPRDAAGAIDIERLVLPLTGASGAVEAWCLAIPFLRPGDVPRAAPADGAGANATAAAAADATAAAGAEATAGAGATAGAAAAAARPAPASDPYLDGIALLYQRALALALQKRQPGQAILAMGHCHMVGGASSNDSERRIVIGGSEMLSASLFGPEVSYAALGHLHLAQSVGQQARIRYCGSPIPLSFAETEYHHQVLRVDLDGAALAAVTPIPVPRAVPLLRVPAKHALLPQVLAELGALEMALALADDGVQPQHWPLLEVRVLLDAPEPGLRARIEAALEGKAVRLAKIDTTHAARGDAGSDAAVLTLDQLDKLQPDDIFRKLYRQKYEQEAPAEQLSAFGELLLPGA